ncbi:hypothetical protein CUMW_276000 [Citrus unshiu]|uniref:Uncharacterized protein n=1 Tax=Citrus unshiu TaxID=55188 RepID=A0A2H5N0C4_CITUN|nr:hypothetical protein CUMW_276000 [Citrus unshiu]
MVIGLKTVWTLKIVPRHQSTCIRIFSNGIVTPHQSMPHHQSMSRHRSVYVNSVVNSNVDNTIHLNSTVHVNNDIFPFMLLLRFSTVLSLKVMYVLPSDFSFIVK